MMQKIHTVVVSAGVGKRFGTQLPKQYTNIYQKTVLEHTIHALSQVSQLTDCYLVISQDDTMAKHLKFAMPIHWVVGGTERIHSVFNGVNAVWQANKYQENDWVLIHDGARPCVLAKDIERLITQATQHISGGILAVPVRDTVKVKTTQKTGELVAKQTLDRNQLWLAQTPQLFPLGKLHHYLTQAMAQHIEFTDEASLFEYFGEQPLLVEGSHSNIKLTFPDDMIFAESFLAHLSKR